MFTVIPCNHLREGRGGTIPYKLFPLSILSSNLIKVPQDALKEIYYAKKVSGTYSVRMHQKQSEGVKNSEVECHI